MLRWFSLKCFSLTASKDPRPKCHTRFSPSCSSRCSLQPGLPSAAFWPICPAGARLHSGFHTFHWLTANGFGLLRAAWAAVRGFRFATQTACSSPSQAQAWHCPSSCPFGFSVHRSSYRGRKSRRSKNSRNFCALAPQCAFGAVPYSSRSLALWVAAFWRATAPRWFSMHARA